PLLGHARILVRSEVRIRPTVKRSLANVREVIGHEVVAEAVALLDRCPQLIGSGIEAQAHGIPRSRGDDLVAGAVGLNRLIAARIGGSPVTRFAEEPTASSILSCLRLNRTVRVTCPFPKSFIGTISSPSPTVFALASYLYRF